MTNNSLLSDLVDLNAVLQTDRAIDLDERKQRDRSIGLKLQGKRKYPDVQARAWLHKVFPGQINTMGQQGVRLYHLLCLGLLMIDEEHRFGVRQKEQFKGSVVAHAAPPTQYGKKWQQKQQRAYQEYRDAAAILVYSNQQLSNTDNTLAGAGNGQVA